MKRLLVLFSAVAALALPLRPLQAGEAEAKAQKAAESWLALTDAAKYAESWDHAAAFFKSKVSKESWVSMVDGVRKPLGKLESRKLKSATFAKTLPGAPDGEYVVLQFDTAFANKKSAVETVTPMKEKDGSFRVSGYYIR